MGVGEDKRFQRTLYLEVASVMLRVSDEVWALFFVMGPAYSLESVGTFCKGLEMSLSGKGRSVYMLHAEYTH